MEDIDRFKAYSAMVESTRKWVSVMDTKAGFLSGLNGSAIVFIWTGAKLTETADTARNLALAATLLLLISLFLTLAVILPKLTLRQAFGRKLAYSSKHNPISFFGYVADTFPAHDHAKFVALVDAMDAKQLAREALEQHYTVCHILQRKSRGVVWAGWIWLIAVVLVVAALTLRG